MTGVYRFVVKSMSALLRGFFGVLEGRKHRFDVARDLHASPLAGKRPVRGNEKGRAHNAAAGFSVHDLVFNHAETVAEDFFLVACEFNGEVLAFAKALMHAHGVARDAHDVAALSGEFVFG